MGAVEMLRNHSLFKFLFVFVSAGTTTIHLCLLEEKGLDNMSTAGYIPPHLSEAQLRALVSDAVEGNPDEDAKETFHARFDHLERGLSLDDVLHGLERPWTFERPPEFNKNQWQWKYRIATESIDGDELVIIIAVDTANRSFEVVTRWRQ